MVADPAGVGGVLMGQVGGTVGPCSATCLLRAHQGAGTRGWAGRPGRRCRPAGPQVLGGWF